jgi:hypothetical protein
MMVTPFCAKENTDINFTMTSRFPATLAKATMDFDENAQLRDCDRGAHEADLKLTTVKCSSSYNQLLRYVNAFKLEHHGLWRN